MPELPEVECVKNIITQVACGRVISAVSVPEPKVIACPDPLAFQSGLQGRTITRLSRRGKFILFHLDDAGRLVLHLRMTGCLVPSPAAAPVAKHTHLILHLGPEGTGLQAGRDDGKERSRDEQHYDELRYVDPRKFGRFWYLAPGEEDQVSGIAALGPEPEQVSADYLAAIFASRHLPVKAALLDQHLIAGIGNIWSDEILFRSGIHPSTKVNTIDKNGLQVLADSIHSVISEAIVLNRSTVSAFVKGEGREYSDLALMNVYGREGQPCKRCGSLIRRLTIGGRSSCFCPHCQPE